jgi:hypothetical protein
LFAVTFAAIYFGKTIRDKKIDASHPDEGQDHSNPRLLMIASSKR